MDISFKRIIAYILDFILIIAISTVIASIPLLNPYKDEYNDAYQKYSELQKSDASINDEIAKANYDVSKYGVVATSVAIVVMFGYFGVYQYYAKGQTVGKRLLKLQVVSNDDRDINIGHFMFRAVILNNIIFRIMIIIGIFIFNYKVFGTYSMVISIIESIIEVVIVLMVVLKQNNRGLHDILCRTKVISLKEKKNSKVIEGKVKN